MSDSSIPFAPRALGSPVPSPCTSVCRIDPAIGLCEGCLRTIDEIIQWRQLTDEAKLAVWAEIESRRASA
jgi:uncharacterized protein